MPKASVIEHGVKENRKKRGNGGKGDSVEVEVQGKAYRTVINLKSNQIYFSVAGNNNTQYKSIHLRV